MDHREDVTAQDASASLGASSSSARATQASVTAVVMRRTSLIALCMMVLVLSMPFSVALSISDLNEITGAREATIEWNTDDIANAFVNFTDGDRSYLVSEPEFTTGHSVRLENLEPSTTYLYRAVSIAIDGDEARSGERSFTTTPEAQGEMFFNADIPAYVSGKPLTFSASTHPDALVIAYVNGIPGATEYADANGTVAIRNLRIPISVPESTLRISVTHPSTDEVLEKEYTVILDNKVPTVRLDKIPQASPDGQLSITGTVDENVTLEIFTRDSAGNVDEAASASVSGTFDVSVSLDDGQYTLKLFFIDKAANEVSFTKTITIDSQPPTILEHNIAEVSPTYSPTVTIRGRVDEPNVTVRIYVNPDTNNFEMCSDGLDNDGDGKTDYLYDPGCSSPTDLSEQDDNVKTQCNDGIDNDDDDKIDFLDDPGCDNLNDNSEADYNVTKTECNDDLDNDGDGATDFLKDKGCTSLDDDSEDSDNNDDYFETRADARGYFSKEVKLAYYLDYRNLKLSESVRALQGDADTIREQPAYDKSYALGAEYSSTGRKNDNNEDAQRIRIIAIDKVGQQSAPIEGDIRFASCGSGGEWNIIQGAVYPGILQPDLLFEGVAQISFNLDFEFYGNGFDPYVTDIHFQRRILSVESSEDYAPDQVLDPSNCQVHPPGGTDSKAYVVCTLNKYPPERTRNITAAYDKLEDMESLTFPLNMIMNYRFVDEFGNPVSKQQETCFDIEMFIDRRLPPDKIPEGLLNGSVEALNAVIDGIDSVLKPLHTITLATTGACLATHLVLMFQTTSLEYNCLGMQNQIPRIQQFIRGAENKDEAMQQVCEIIEKEQDEKGNAAALGSTCAQCAASVKSNLETRKFFSQVCDRIYCPVTPTAQKYVEDVNKNPLLQMASACSTQDAPDGAQSAVGGASGNPYAETVSGSIEQNPEFTKKKGCGLEYYDEWGSSCLGYEAGGKDIVAASKALGNGTRKSPGILDALNQLNFCKAAEQADNESFLYGDDAFLFSPEQKCFTLGDDPYQRIGDAQQQRDGSLQGELTNKISIQRYNLGETSEDLEKKGYTECVRTANDGSLYFVPSMNMGNAVGNAAGGAPATFNAQDTSRPIVRGVVAGTQGQAAKQSTQVQYVRTLEKGEYLVTSRDQYFTTSIPPDAAAGKASSEIELTTWEPEAVYATSSRNKQYYTKDTLPEGKEADAEKVRGPSRLKSGEVPDTLIDARGSFINSLRCVCLPAIQGYLEKIRGILAAIRNCLQGVLVTKEFNPGMCKAVLTQYLCDWIFEAIGCFVKASTLSDSELAVGARENGPNAIEKSLTAIGRAGKRTRDYASSRYGGTGTFETLFTQRKLLHAACLAAFGYDWLPELDAAVSISGEGFSINSSAFISPATRRFMSSNPFQRGVATHIYHVGYFVAAGGDVNYNVELVCSSDNSCDPSDGFEAGRCDCSWQGTQRSVLDPNSIASDGFTGGNYYGRIPPSAGTVPAQAGGAQREGCSPNVGRTYLIDSGFLEGGQTSEGQGEIYRQVTDIVRYDKVRVSWSPRSASGYGGCIEFPVSAIGGVPAECSFNLQLMQFACNYEVQAAGEAFFRSEPRLVGGINQLQPGDEVQFELDVQLLYPDVTTQPASQRLPKYTRVILYDHQGRIQGTRISKSSFLDDPNPVKVFPTNDDPLYVGASSNYNIQTGRLQQATYNLADREDIILNGVSQDVVAEVLWKRDTDGQPVCEYKYQAITDSQNSGVALPEKWQQCAQETDSLILDDLGIDIRINAVQRKQVLSGQVLGSRITLRETPTQIACEGKPYVEWKAEVSLHGSIVDDPRREISRTNSRMSQVPIVYQGKEQRHEVLIRVPCSTDNGGGICPPNEIFSPPCLCGARQYTTQTNQGTELLSRSYCSIDPESKIESVKQAEGIAVCDPQPSVVSQGCWCIDVETQTYNNKTINPSRDDSTGWAYCDPGQECYVSGGTRFCRQPLPVGEATEAAETEKDVGKGDP